LKCRVRRDDHTLRNYLIRVLFLTYQVSSLVLTKETILGIHCNAMDERAWTWRDHWLIVWNKWELFSFVWIQIEQRFCYLCNVMWEPENIFPIFVFHYLRRERTKEGNITLFAYRFQLILEQTQLPIKVIPVHTSTRFLFRVRPISIKQSFKIWTHNPGISVCVINNGLPTVMASEIRHFIPCIPISALTHVMLIYPNSTLIPFWLYHKTMRQSRIPCTCHAEKRSHAFLNWLLSSLTHSKCWHFHHLENQTQSGDIMANLGLCLFKMELH